MTTTFILYSDLSREAKTQVREFNAAMKVFLNPTSANPIEMGEYFQLDTTATSSEYMTRAAGDIPSYPYYLERGRPEPQILGRGSFLFTHAWQADTLIMTATSIVIGSMLKVDDVTYDSTTKSGLVLHDGTGADFVVGYCLRVPANNNNYLKYQSLSPFRIA